MSIPTIPWQPDKVEKSLKRHLTKYCPRNPIMKVTETRKDEIAEFAEDISCFYFPDSKVIPEKLANENRISFAYDSYPDEFDGLLIYNEGGFHIELNMFRLKSEYSPRTRFTFCHELGHYFLDEHRNSLLNGGSLFHVSRSEYQSDLAVEVEADTFASNLLMPKKRFTSLAKKSKFGFEGILKLSQYFDVSLSAAAVRFVQSDIRPSIILKWDKEGKLDWKFYSKDFFQASLGKTFVKGSDFNRAIRDSATDKAILGYLPESGSFFQNGTTTTAWFPNVHGFKNDILIEQAFPIGEYGTITMLFTDNSKFSFSC